MTGRKDDGEKSRVDLLPVRALLSVADVFGYGAKKYSDWNWHAVYPRRRYYGAALRHLFARARGEKLDPESGLPHLSHAICCLMILLSAELGLECVDTFENPTGKP